MQVSLKQCGKPAVDKRKALGMTSSLLCSISVPMKGKTVGASVGADAAAVAVVAG